MIVPYHRPHRMKKKKTVLCFRSGFCIQSFLKMRRSDMTSALPEKQVSQGNDHSDLLYRIKCADAFSKSVFPIGVFCKQRMIRHRTNVPLRSYPSENSRPETQQIYTFGQPLPAKHPLSFLLYHIPKKRAQRKIGDFPHLCRSFCVSETPSMDIF